ncbi:MAG: cyclic nucleotide-binding domain-containing protein [Elusimicrobia bacterium]|nr:cyclic nucleotide-binding domain-containing protein [Elusimicrobiota bacterium]
MTPFDDTMFLKTSVDVLSFFNEDQLRRITPDIERTTYKKGQTVILRGEVSSGFYIIKKGGAAAVYVSPGGVVSRALKVGDFFGVVSLLEDMPSDASIKAAEDETEILTIPAEPFRRLLEMQPILKSSLLAKVAERRKELQSPKK